MGTVTVTFTVTVILKVTVMASVIVIVTVIILAATSALTGPDRQKCGHSHMTCQKCRHEFCWLCLGDYRKHQSETGIGLCNNFNDVQKINRTNIGDMAERMRVDRKMRKFAHFATLYNEHLRSVKLDQKRGDQLDHQI